MVGFFFFLFLFIVVMELGENIYSMKKKNYRIMYVYTQVKKIVWHRANKVILNSRYNTSSDICTKSHLVNCLTMIFNVY